MAEEQKLAEKPEMTEEPKIAKQPNIMVEMATVAPNQTRILSSVIIAPLASLLTKGVYISWCRYSSKLYSKHRENFESDCRLHCNPMAKLEVLNNT